MKYFLGFYGSEVFERVIGSNYVSRIDKLTEMVLWTDYVLSSLKMYEYGALWNW